MTESSFEGGRRAALVLSPPPGGFRPPGQPRPLVLRKRGEQVEDELAVRAGGVEQWFSEGTEPYPPLSQHRHDVSQVRGTTAQPCQIRNCQNIAWLEVVQACLPTRSRLGGARGVLLKHAHCPCGHECIHLGIQRLPAGADPRVTNYVARHVKKPSLRVLTNFHFGNQL